MRDYNNWRHLELDKYGQGGKPQAAPASLEGVYSSRVMGLRMRYPQEWKTTENLKLKVPEAKLSDKREEVARFEKEGGKAKMVVYGVMVEGETVDIVDKEATGITRERDYINTDGASLAILTWERGSEVKQKAIGSRGGRLVILEATCDADEWSGMEPIFWAMYERVVMI